MVPTLDPTVPETLLDTVLEAGVQSLFQPIVSLTDGAVVGYEALTRGPANTALESPAALFAAARAARRLHDLTWVCRGAALAERSTPACAARSPCSSTWSPRRWPCRRRPRSRASSRGPAPGCRW